MNRSRHSYLLLIYQVPTQPSAARVAVWRELKRLGALYLQQSVCVMPLTAAYRGKRVDDVRCGVVGDHDEDRWKSQHKERSEGARCQSNGAHEKGCAQEILTMDVINTKKSISSS